MRYGTFLLMASLSIAGCNSTDSTTNDNLVKQGSSNDVDRDNSVVNKRDHDGRLQTPIDQNENSADINTTASIRRTIVDTKMSVNAKNVKIITQDGFVTLRGPVKSPEEKLRIEEIARSVVGVKTIDSQLDVEANH